MSAIAGMFWLDGRPVERPELEAMNNALAHRGPDGAGVWIGGSAGLAHQMMWTTPESLHERLPLVEAESGLVITADARIDNREELIGRFASTGTRSEHIGDSLLILRAYQKWGVRCVDWLIGDYAFALWDPHEQQLFCARDPLAAKHFYYYHRRNTLFVFASEIKALLTLPGVPRELNELQVAYHLLPIYDDKINTFYKHIFRCPASHSMTVRRDGVTFHRSWTPDLSRELRLRSDAEYAAAFREIFSEAVRCRTRSAFPVGSMLSGGLDSSAITCVARTQAARDGREPLKTFSAVWPDIGPKYPEIDEQPFMRAVIAQGGVDAHFVHLDRTSPLHEWQRMYWHQDQTLSAPNMYLDWAVFKSAHEQGVRVLLGGTDGDTVVGYGYEELEHLVRRGRWVKLWREARQLSRTMPRPAHTMHQLVWARGFRPVIPERVKQLRRVLRGEPARPTTASALPGYSKERPWNPEFVKRVSLEEQVSTLYAELYPAKQSLRESRWSDISSGSWSYILECFEKAGAAHHVEMRYPFFDRRLVEFSIALPPGQRIQGGYTRSILRRAMEGILPPEVQWRADKGNLSAGVCLNLLEFERQALDQMVAADSSLRPYYDVEGLRAIYARYTADAVGRQGDAFTVILAAGLWLWLRSRSRDLVA